MTRIRLNVYLRADEPLTIGWGYPGLTGTDISLFRFEPSITAKPVIPGSTVKGVLRTIATRVARILGLKVCDGIAPEDIKQCIRSGGSDLLLEMFGAPDTNNPSALRISPFTLVETDIQLYTIKHVSLNRRSLKAEEGALYSEEVVLPCTVFKGEIVLECNKGKCDKMLELLLLSLLELEYFGLGRNSRRVSVKIEVADKDLLDNKEIVSDLSRKILAIASDFRKPCIR